LPFTNHLEPFARDENDSVHLHRKRLPQPDGRGAVPSRHGRARGFRVLSAGIGAVDGQPPTPHSVQAMRELGIDISGQRSRDAHGGIWCGRRILFSA
jgi:hypothetical protein